MRIRKAREIKGPRYDLQAFQAEVRAENFHVYKTRALDVIARLRKCGRDQARAYAKQVILSLTDDDYAHTLEMPNGQVMDVYGKVIQVDGWYVKIEIHQDDKQPGIVSCHPAERDLQTAGGLVPRAKRR